MGSKPGSVLGGGGWPLAIHACMAEGVRMRQEAAANHAAHIRGGAGALGRGPVIRVWVYNVQAVLRNHKTLVMSLNRPNQNETKQDKT